MTVSVNPVQPKQDSGQDDLFRALQLATSVYGVKLDKERQAKLDAITAAKDADAKATETAKTAREIEKDAVAFTKDFVPVKEGTAGAAALKIPGTQTTGFFLPRSEVERKDKDRLEWAKLNDTKKKDPNAKSSSEVAYRYNVLQKNAEELKNIIKKYGTAEFTGSAGSDMDSKIYQMAVDYAKLIDPESVAREGEVAAAQKYMLPIRDWGGMATSNKTAESVIDNYTKALDTRLEARIDALEKSGQDTSSLKEIFAGKGGKFDKSPQDLELEALLAEKTRRLKLSNTAGK